MNKIQATKILNSLDRTAGLIEKLAASKKIDSTVASQLVRTLDETADKTHIAAFGLGSFRAHQAKVLQRESDEPYMATYDNPNRVHESDADEPYMHQMGPSFNSKGIGTYDVDQTSTVSERDEYAVREAHPLSDGTKRQPSWPRGSAGKSLPHQASSVKKDAWGK